MNRSKLNHERSVVAQKVFSIAVALSIFWSGSMSPPALAADYPSWQDVQAAKANEAAAAESIKQIESLIGNLEVEAAESKRVAEEKGQLLLEAQQRLDEVNLRVSRLEKQAQEAEAKAQQSSEQAGRIATQFYRSGGGSFTARLLLGGTNSDNPDQLLSDLGSMSKVIEQSQRIYEEAVTAKNTSQALSDQAQAAKKERETLRAEAESVMQAAAQAVQASQDKLQEQSDRAVVLEAQLAALRDVKVQTVQDYEKGVAERAAAAAAAAAAASARGSGNLWWGSGAGLPGGHVGSQGWAVPVSGRVSDGFGPRISPGGIGSTYHQGIDMSASCGTPIYAANAGVVKYAGPFGSYGNFVLIDHGSGVNTGYAHIVYGGVLVRVGQQVSAGDPIARVGSTGASTGCHLHYEVRINGVKIDGIPFMKERGAPLG